MLAAWKLRHTYREQNQTTDLMAKEGTKYDHFGDIRIFVFSPLFVQGTICIENSGTSFPRNQTVSNLSYSGWDVALRQYFITNYLDM